MTWEVSYRASVEKDIVRLPAEIRQVAARAISGLLNDPFHQGCKKLRGPKNRYRLRVAGDYRVVYSVFKQERCIVVEFVGHRKDAYRWF
jgi:mRNA interferase RelE/StbE